VSRRLASTKHEFTTFIGKRSPIAFADEIRMGVDGLFGGGGRQYEQCSSRSRVREPPGATRPNALPECTIN